MGSTGEGAGWGSTGAGEASPGEAGIGGGDMWAGFMPGLCQVYVEVSCGEGGVMWR